MVIMQALSKIQKEVLAQSRLNNKYQRQTRNLRIKSKQSNQTRSKMQIRQMIPIVMKAHIEEKVVSTMAAKCLPEMKRKKRLI